MKKAVNISVLLGKLKNGTISEEELKVLFESIKKSETDFELKSAFYDHWHLLDMDVPDEDDPELQSGRFSRMLKMAKERELQEPGRTRKKFYKWYSAAAVVVIFILAYSLFYFNGKEQISSQQEAIQWVERQTSRGQHLTIRLSDGSKISLNAESKIRFPNKFRSDKREVILTGEGFFEIKKNPDLPFVVTTGEIQTTVLGTSFNVRSYDEESMVQIAVKSGRVAVSDENQKLILTPNQVATYDNRKKFVKEERDIESLIAWTDGGFIFDQKPLEEIVKELERMYDVDISIDDPSLKHIQITLKQQGESLTTVLDILSKSGGFDYEINEKNVQLKSKRL